MTVKRPRDSLYASPLEAISDFRFDESVAEVFADMINRSVPGYGTLISMLGVIANRFAQPDSRCYDLGCSLGASTLAMRHGINKPGIEIIAVDNSDAMIEKCRQHITSDEGGIPVEVICDDIRNVEIENTSFVVLNFTLQFLSPEDRLALLTDIASGLCPGGALLLSEKVKFTDLEQNDLFIDLHHDFKRARGYSDLEISQKRTALENVLIPDTLEQHKERLGQAGFSRSEVWFQCLNFVSMLAIK